MTSPRRVLAAAEFAREHGRFEAMHHALFKAHWELTGRLENVDDLVAIGTAVGLEPEALRRAIEDGRYAAGIDETRTEAQSGGGNPVPPHVFRSHGLGVG